MDYRVNCGKWQLTTACNSNQGLVKWHACRKQTEITIIQGLRQNENNRSCIQESTRNSWQKIWLPLLGSKDLVLVQQDNIHTKSTHKWWSKNNSHVLQWPSHEIPWKTCGGNWRGPQVPSQGYWFWKVLPGGMVKNPSKSILELMIRVIVWIL